MSSFKYIDDKGLFDNSVYDQTFNINNYTSYKSKDYYDWINNSFKGYAFPDDYVGQDFDSICNATGYSLKQQQKLGARLFNTDTENKGMLV